MMQPLWQFSARRLTSGKPENSFDVEELSHGGDIQTSPLAHLASL